MLDTYSLEVSEIPRLPFKYWVILALYFVSSIENSAYSNHALGGEITIQTSQDSIFKIELIQYFDCLQFNELYSPPLFSEIAIFKNNEFFITKSLLRVDTIRTPILESCINVSPTLCTNFVRYVLIDTLPPLLSDERYDFVYQNCCRENELNNIEGTDLYFSYTSTIFQHENNNQTYFNASEGLIFCINKPFSLDFLSTDVENDQLIYSLSTPLLKESENSSCSVNDNIYPCPPPYESVTYLSPNYTITKPLGSTVAFNALEGKLQGQVDFVGKYLFGIRVDEYRDGLLISSRIRDIQVQFINCQPIFSALLPAPTQNGTYQYQSCTDTTFTFGNESTNVENIDSLIWQFSHGYTTSEWEPTVDFPGTGEYTGLLVLNPGQECADTARLAVTIHPDPQADFDYAYDPCVAGPVAYYDRSSGGTPPYTYAWDFGDGGTDSLPNPLAQYAVPGPFQASLAVTDANDCADTLVQLIDYRPAPAVLVVAPADTLGCPPVSIRFDNLSVPVDTTYTVLWTFGDGGSSDRIDPAHTYTEVGVYDVSLSIESPLGCLIDTVFRELIRIQAPPSAAFTADPQRPTSLQPDIELTAEDPTLPRYAWQVNGTPVAEHPTTTYTFPDTGSYVLSLVVTDRAYCQDTVTQTVRVAPAATFFLPNAFTPNDDGRNDFFGGTGETRYLTDFSLQVFDRYGGVAFTASDPAARWDGRLRGKPLTQGVYTWRVAYVDTDGERVTQTGNVMLMR